MHARIVELTSDRLPGLPPTCRSCLYWELADSRSGPDPDAEQGAARKEAWVQAVTLDVGPPGRVAVREGQTIGYALAAPARELGRHRRLTRRPSADALLLAVAWVAPEHRGRGVGQALVEAVLRDVVRWGGRALEAYGARTPVSSCLLPEGFLHAVGFTVLHEHPLTPLLRLDLRQTVRWPQSVEQAWQGVREALSGRERQPAPEGAPAS